MENRYDTFEFYICTFKIKENGVVPNITDYPYRRLCVVDNKRKKVIDIEHELEYDYIETMSQLYFINESSKKIKENKRAAIFPVIVLSLKLDQRKKVSSIINKIENGYQFPDGNDVLSNQEYLNSFKKEKSKAKIKCFKRKK